MNIVYYCHRTKKEFNIYPLFQKDTHFKTLLHLINMSSLTPQLVKTLQLLMLSNKMSIGISQLHLVSFNKAKFSTTRMQNTELKLPKVPLTAYMRYSMKEYPSVTAANPKLPVSQIASIIGQRWRELGEAEKQIYHKERSNDMAKYKSEMAKIESDPGSKDQLQQIKEEKSKKNLEKRYRKALKERKELLSDLDRPKRPLTAFNIFASQKLIGSKYKTQLEKFSELSELWTGLKAEEKEVYAQMAQTLKEKYDNDLEKWKLKMHSNDQLDNIEDAHKKINSIRKKIKSKMSETAAM